ncbi:hypothetical protein [Paraburkholderia sacchari]|uniref:hypothetical protein n=1 Tax=Paraburkholderia sacchari TaxID=159450 RepID=UPI001BCB91A9|nr:hypothetical protein [Paraburkholderia sacchari]
MAPRTETRLDLHLAGPLIESNSKFVRAGQRRVDSRRNEYGIAMPYEYGLYTERAIAELRAEMHSTADFCNSWIEGSLRNPVTDTYWG